MDFGEWESNKCVSAAWPNTRGNLSDQMYLRFGSQEVTGATVDWDAMLPFTPGDGTQIDVDYVDGRLIAYQVGATSGGVWRFSGMKVNARKSGKVAVNA